MAFIDDEACVSGLDNLNTLVDRADICSQEPTTYTEATSTYTLGNKTSFSVGAPTNGDTDGRKVVGAAISDGSVTSTGTASHFAWSDVSATKLWVTNSLASSQSVTSGNTFTLTATDVTFRDP